MSKVDINLDMALLEGSSCAFGVFDGVHRGHDFIIRSMIEKAKKDNTRSCIITFDIDPDEIFNAQSHRKLMSNSARVATLAEYPVDCVLVLPFNMELASQEPVRFLDEQFGGNVPSSIHIGEDFRFGAKAKGTICDLMEWGGLHNMEVLSYPLMSDGEGPITSTRIRKLLEDGRVEEAHALLGHAL